MTWRLVGAEMEKIEGKERQAQVRVQWMSLSSCSVVVEVPASISSLRSAGDLSARVPTWYLI